MGDIAAFVTGDIILKNNGPTWTFKVQDAAVVAGMVVGFDATGTSFVRPMTAEAGESPVGVALTAGAIGDFITVALPGSICLMTNADDTTAIDSGSFVETNDNAVGGTVTAASEAASGAATCVGHFAVVGKALEDIAGGSFGPVLISYSPLTQVNSS